MRKSILSALLLSLSFHIFAMERENGPENALALEGSLFMAGAAGGLFGGGLIFERTFLRVASFVTSLRYQRYQTMNSTFNVIIPDTGARLYISQLFGNQKSSRGFYTELKAGPAFKFGYDTGLYLGLKSAIGYAHAFASGLYINAALGYNGFISSNGNPPSWPEVNIQMGWAFFL